MVYFDAHCHIQPKTQFVNAQKAGVKYFFCNATHPDNWQSVCALNQSIAGVFPCLGIHPWFIQNLPSNWINQLHQLLETYPEMMIGEIGLDGTHPNLEQQANIFEICLKTAQKYKRPVHIHGHKAWSTILNFLKCYPNLICVLHRFGGNDALVRQFLKFPYVYFSVMHAKPVRFIPNNRLFIESDAPDGLNFSEKIIEFIQQNQINPHVLYQNLIQFSELFPALKPYIDKGKNL